MYLVQKMTFNISSMKFLTNQDVFIKLNLIRGAYAIVLATMYAVYNVTGQN